MMTTRTMRIGTMVFFGFVVLLLLASTSLMWLFGVEIVAFPGILGWVRGFAILASAMSITFPMWPLRPDVRERLAREPLPGMSTYAFLTEGLSMISAAYGFAVYVFGGTLLEMALFCLVALGAIMYWGWRNPQIGNA
ncbi:MAG TPA: hypothetical protein PLC98_23375 [Anaerolineales bacterium]|nr:hypothetical protein [Anaerolineales bacterium]